MRRLRRAKRRRIGAKLRLHAASSPLLLGSWKRIKPQPMKYDPIWVGVVRSEDFGRAYDVRTVRGNSEYAPIHKAGSEGQIASKCFDDVSHYRYCLELIDAGRHI